MGALGGCDMPHGRDGQIEKRYQIGSNANEHTVLSSVSSRTGDAVSRPCYHLFRAPHRA